MRTIVLSDIHANLPAFRAVLQDAGKWDRVVFLGDVANFGPHPAECIDLLRELDPICVIGNHDVYIAQHWAKKDVNAFDAWSRTRIGEEQKKWLRSLPENCILQGDAGEVILLTHGAYDVPYDVLPGIPDALLREAFEKQITPDINSIWFGHYHYQLDREVDQIGYHCIRPVGHHRDRDTRAGYSIYENGNLTHYKVAYDVEQTVYDTEQRMTFLEEPLKSQWIELLRNAWQEELLRKDIETMEGWKVKE